MHRREYLLGDVLEFYDHMRVPLSSLERDTRQGEYRYYGAQGVIDHIDSYIYDGQFVLIAEDGANLVTRNEPIAFLVNGQFWVNNHAHVVKGKDGVADDYYVTKLLNSMNIAGFITGAAQPKLSQQNLKQVKVALPSHDAQRRIADNLSAYDDLIENNQRRMALLEGAARQLYREWFVRLRFPGHEHTRIVDGVPEGWERTTLGRCAQFLSGGTPSKARAEFWEGDIPWVSSGELTAMRISRTTLNITEEAVESGSRVVSPETILAVVRGMSLAKEFRIGLAAREVAFNQDLKAIVSRPGVDSLLLFHTLEAQRDQIRDRAGEASHGTKKLETPVLASVPVLLPAERMQRHFREHAQVQHAQWDNLDQQNKKLRAARDLLLPRLMSGEIAV